MSMEDFPWGRDYREGKEARPEHQWTTILNSQFEEDESENVGQLILEQFQMSVRKSLEGGHWEKDWMGGGGRGQRNIEPYGNDAA